MTDSLRTDNPTLPLRIDNLCERPHWIPRLAVWHHRQWSTTYGPSSHGRAAAPKSLAQSLMKRQNALHQHLTEAAVPSTFVASVHERPVATVSLIYHQFPGSAQPNEWLSNLYVLPKYRRQGIANRLLRTAIEYAHQHQVARLRLYTTDQSEFYQKRHWRLLNRGVIQGQKVVIMDYPLRV